LEIHRVPETVAYRQDRFEGTKTDSFTCIYVGADRGGAVGQVPVGYGPGSSGNVRGLKVNTRGQPSSDGAVEGACGIDDSVCSECLVKMGVGLDERREQHEAGKVLDVGRAERHRSNVGDSSDDAFLDDNVDQATVNQRAVQDQGPLPI
jgi:hypothetical protein